MQVEQLSWSEAAGWRTGRGAPGDADLVLYFGSGAALACGARYGELRSRFPGAHVMGCSTGGQIMDDDVDDAGIVAVALRFGATKLRLASEMVTGPERSRACGEALGRQLSADDLAGIFVLSDGLQVNGSELIAGIAGALGRTVPVTGGLAGDGARFSQTLVGADCVPGQGRVAAVGFYGAGVRISHGSAGGWDVFGPRRHITRSAGRVLFELDGQPALDLYERYLSEEAEGLPGAGLLFPLKIWDPARPRHDVVRTVLAIDRDARSMTFAGDMPEGWGAQLMRGNFDRLAMGAGDAARQAHAGRNGTDASSQDSVAVLVSCIGRRLLMGQRAADEVEAACAELGPATARLGFYSYGEIAPHAVSGACELHNQTMTVTLIAEALE